VAMRLLWLVMTASESDAVCVYIVPMG
jgi:hypothetical protein